MIIILLVQIKNSSLKLLGAHQSQKIFQISQGLQPISKKFSEAHVRLSSSFENVNAILCI